MIVDRELAFEEPRCERVEARPAGEGSVHISFKQGYRIGAEVLHGCMLVPLRDAIAMACYLMMVPDETVGERREATELDRITKDALLEVGNFVAAAIDGAVRARAGDAVAVRAAGCQGVRADVRPAFPYEEGAPLLACRLAATLQGFDPFEVVLVLPPLGELIEA